jgi:diaminohydroxyphosphoribosylaminopyrimidine deaminase/5-amino-6-(5-phosphoribosylamino)uracil reductase
MTAIDSVHMAHALRLAARARFTAHPNPMVGCVLVNNGDVVGEGFHKRSGEAHAEVLALRSAGDLARGATVYVTLEPCAHHGKTPPCVDALVDAGVSKVMVAMQDPFAATAGRGIERLEAAGIDVCVGLMQSAASELNAGYLSRVTRDRPFVRLKLATSIDGAIAMASGESQWITGAAARADVQRLRASAGAIVTGIGTVLADDPSMTVRAVEIDCGGLQPLRVVFDSHLRMPPAATMLTLAGTTLVCHAGDNDGAAQTLLDAGAELMLCQVSDARVDAKQVLTELATRGVNTVLVEAGAELAGYFLQHELVDELVIYQAPHIMGSETRGLVSTPSWQSLSDRVALKVTDVRRVGSDTRITAIPERSS